MHFEFATAARIVFGPGALKQAGPLVADLGRRALLVTGRSPHRAERLRAQLEAVAVRTLPYALNGEPTTAEVERGVALARQEGCDLVISFGGGSAIDAGKAIAALLTNDGGLLDYLEVIGQGKPLSKPGVPFVAIPTTAGTGTEATRNAVLSSPSHEVKASLRSPFLLARLALVDPELTLGLPAPLTASTGMDALTQLIEPYTCCRPNPWTDALCVEGLHRAARSLRRAFESGQDLAAREDMCVASLFSGVALANAGLGAAHGFAAPIGGGFPAPHGAVCAALLPEVMRANIRALRERLPASDVLSRYQRIAIILTGNPAATAEDGVQWVTELCATLQIPPLRAYGIRPEDFPRLVEKAAHASSMKANPIPLWAEELKAILEGAW